MKTVIINNGHHIQLKKRLDESLPVGQSQIKELGNKFYLKLRDSYSMVSVYCILELPYDKEDVYRLWGNVVHNIFLTYNGKEKLSTTKKYFIEKLLNHEGWKNIHPKLKEFILDFVKNSPSNLIHRKHIADAIFKQRDEIPPRQIGEAHFYKEKGSKILERPIKGLTFKIDPNKEYLQGANHTQSVFVQPEFRGKNIATAMYKFAEEQTGLKIVPSNALSGDGKILHKKLGNIE